MLSRVAELPRIPGFVNAHCHAFQRALRGRTEGEDFWAWRETMLELAAAQTAETVRRVASRVSGVVGVDGVRVRPVGDSRSGT